MSDFSIQVFLMISVISAIIMILIIKKEPLKTKIIYLFTGFGVYMYSGVGLSYEYSDKFYIPIYFLFYISLLITIKLVFHFKINNKRKSLVYRGRIDYLFNNDIDVYSNSKLIDFFSVLFILTLVIYLFVPSFRVMDFFLPEMRNISLNNIYDASATYDSNIILKLSSTINTMTLPFFCLFLHRLVNDGKKAKAIFLVLLWAYLDFLKLNYMGRYKMVIFFVFVFSLIYFINKDGLKIKSKYIIVLGGVAVLAVPFLYSFMAIRSGGIMDLISLSDSFQLLIESEIYYPKYYSTCSDIYLQEGGMGVMFLLYILCLPIPSIIFPGKPTVMPTSLFTFALIGKEYGKANYVSCLPSIVGEGIIIWGDFGVIIHAVVLGIVIGVFLKFLMKYKSLTVLYAYYTINLLALGRGGAESYLSGLINGTICLIVWIVVFRRYERRKQI